MNHFTKNTSSRQCFLYIQTFFIYISCNRNGGVLNLYLYHISTTSSTLKLCMLFGSELFLAQLTEICKWYTMDFIRSDRGIIYVIRSSKYFTFLYISCHTLCRFSDTRINMMSQKRCYIRDSQNNAKTYKMHGSSPPASEICLQMSVVLYWNQSIHVKI